MIAYGSFKDGGVSFPRYAFAADTLEILVSLGEKIHDAWTCIGIGKAYGLTNGFFTVKDNLIRGALRRGCGHLGADLCRIIKSGVFGRINEVVSPL